MAANNSYEVGEDHTLRVRPRGVLANDRDADGDWLTASLVRCPGHGRLDLNANGSFTYRPYHNYNGSDTFVYKARDGKGGSDNATVTIRVRALRG